MTADSLNGDPEYSPRRLEDQRGGAWMTSRTGEVIEVRGHVLSGKLSKNSP
jgi:hypothetical protein